MTLADDLKKPIIPLKFEEMDLRQQGELSMILTRLIYINMTQGPGDIPRDKCEELVRKIKEHVDDEPEPGYLARFAGLVGLDKCNLM